MGLFGFWNKIPRAPKDSIFCPESAAELGPGRSEINDSWRGQLGVISLPHQPLDPVPRLMLEEDQAMKLLAIPAIPHKEEI